MQGIIIINKPASFTSMDCCAIIRKATHERRVGHTGTLDPNATGVLPICIGKATRLIEYMDNSPKTYIAGFRLGMISDTEDIWGNLIQNEFSPVSRESLINAMSSFIGRIEQIPPMYSAKKINGQKLYDLARNGKEVERKANSIIVYRLDLLEFDGQNGRFEIECSRGTYVRTICADIGRVLGCGAVMTSLVRTKASGFEISEAVDLLEIKALLDEKKEIELSSCLQPMDKALRDYPAINIRPEHQNRLSSMILNGNPDAIGILCDKYNLKDLGRLAAVYSSGRLLAVVEDMKISKVFHE